MRRRRPCRYRARVSHDPVKGWMTELRVLSFTCVIKYFSLHEDALQYAKKWTGLR